LPTEKRAQLVQRAARAQWGPGRRTPKKADDGPWAWPIDLDRYDRSSALTAVEEDVLTRYAEAYRFYRYGRHMDFGPTLDRLVRPLNDALDYIGISTTFRRYLLLFLLREMAQRRRAFWGWTTDEWLDSIHRRKLERQHLLATAYLLCGFSDLHRIEKDHIIYLCLARKIFGREYVNVIAERVRSLLMEWGYMHDMHKRILRTCLRSAVVQPLSTPRAAQARTPAGRGRSPSATHWKLLRGCLFARTSRHGHYSPSFGHRASIPGQKVITWSH
jgi:hypothetical protein